MFSTWNVYMCTSGFEHTYTSTSLVFYVLLNLVVEESSFRARKCLASVVQRMDNACFANTYPLSSDLSGG